MFRDSSSSTKVKSTDHTTNSQLLGRKSYLVSILGIVMTGGIFFVSQLAPIFLLVIILSATGSGQETIERYLTESTVVQFFVYVTISLTMLFLLKRVLTFLRIGVKDFLLLRKKFEAFWLVEAVVAYGVYFVTFIIIASIISAYSSVNIDQTQELGIAEPKGAIALLMTYIMLVILPSVTEEIVFRGFLFNWLKRSATIPIAYIVTSLLFGLAHLEYDNLNWIATIDTLIFSVFLIYLSQKQQSLYGAIALHAIKNSVAFVFLFVLA